MTPRLALRDATRAAHERVDAAFGVHDLTDRAGYARFLAAQAAAFGPVEQALGEAGAGRLIDEWDASRRAPLLAADIATLGMAEPPRITPPTYADDAALAGGLYVLEGSRFGGAVLRRRVPGGLPTSFLAARAAPARWAGFVARLDGLLDQTQSLNKAIAAAMQTFACFELAADEERA